jgi:hypothetical protein
MTGKTGAFSDHAELHLARFADYVLVPGRVPNEQHIGFIDAQNFALRIVYDRRSHAATRRSKRDLHIHFQAALSADNRKPDQDQRCSRESRDRNIAAVGSRPLVVAAPLAQLEKSAGLLVDLAHRN